MNKTTDSFIRRTEDLFQCFSCGPTPHPGFVISKLEYSARGERVISCPNCGLRVRLSESPVPESWYEDNGDPPYPKEHEALPFCETCNHRMLVVSTCTNLQWDAKSICFHCLKDGVIIHRLEGYFVPVPPEEIKTRKRELAGTYAYLMLAELVAHGITLDRVLNGPEYVTMNLSNLSNEERNELIQNYWGFQFIGLVTELDVQLDKMIIRFNKEILREKAKELESGLSK